MIAKSHVIFFVVAAWTLLAFCDDMTNAGEDKKTVVCFGDSYTEGLGANASQSYPSLLQKALPDVRVVNSGVSGDTAQEGLYRITDDVLDHSPDLVIVEFGTNEAFRGYPVRRALENLEIIVKKLTEAGAGVIIIGTRFGSYQENFEEGLSQLASKYNAGLVLNVLGGILGRPELCSDPYHPNAEGYRIMAERIIPEVKRALGAE